MFCAFTRPRRRATDLHDVKKNNDKTVFASHPVVLGTRIFGRRCRHLVIMRDAILAATENKYSKQNGTPLVDTIYVYVSRVIS